MKQRKPDKNRQYCDKCGRKNKITKYLHEYDGKTGKPSYWFRYRCPNLRGFFSLHTDYDEGKFYGSFA